jgi:hypothetical protein
MDSTAAPPPDPPRDLGVYQLFLHSLGVSWRALPTLFAIYFPLAVLSTVLLFVGAPTLADPPRDGRAFVVPSSEWIAFGGWILCILSFGAWSAAAMFHAAGEAFAGRPVPGPFAAYGAAVERVPSLFATQLLYGLAVGVGFVFCFLPGIWLLVLLAPALARAATRGAGPIVALREARELVTGRWWRVAGFLGLVLLTVYAALSPYMAMNFLLPQGETFGHVVRGAANTICTTLIAVVQIPAYVALNDRLEEVP